MPTHERYLAALDAGHSRQCALVFAAGEALSPARRCHCRAQPVPQAWGPDPESFGAILKLRRLERMWSARELARCAGVSKSSIRDWERGRKTPRPAYRTALRVALGLSEDADGGWWSSRW